VPRLPAKNACRRRRGASHRTVSLAHLSCFARVKPPDLNISVSKPHASPLPQVEEIARVKLPDLNTDKIQSAINTVMGTCRNMGITVTE
jgi:hypothetical protein